MAAAHRPRIGQDAVGSNWSLEMGLSRPEIHVGVCAPTYEGVRAICFEGESGIIAEARRNGIEITDYNKNRLEITLPNGSKIRGFSAEKPDSIRGENLSYCWFDELAVIRYMAFYHEGLMPALRKGENPRMVITTTPKRIRLLRDLLADGENEAETGVHVTRGHSRENPHFARRQREALERKYANTYLLKQELEGELVGEVDGCLFPLGAVQRDPRVPRQGRPAPVAACRRRYDPATTSRDSSRRVRDRRHGRRGRRGLLLPGGLLRAGSLPTSRCGSSPRRSTGTTRTALSLKSTWPATSSGRCWTLWTRTSRCGPSVA